MKNWKRNSWLLILFCINSQLYAQKLNKEIQYSINLKDSISYHIWLPDNWNVQQKYPVILMYNYGAINENLLASTVNYYANQLRTIPNSIVVNVLVDMDQIGFNYKTGDITNAGKKLITCL